GQPLDRRSDIFALGLVLYELTTARRVFHAQSAAQTIQAICDHLIVPPSRLSASYPPALEAVCMRALSTAPEDRYATALDMRRDLLAAVRELPATQEPNDALASLMQAIFEDRVAEKRDLLRRLRSGSNVTHVPAGETDQSVEIAPVPAELVTQIRTSGLSGTSSVASPPHPPRTGLVWGLAAGGALAAAALFFVSRPSPHAPAAAAIAPAAAPLAEAPASSEVPVPGASSGPVATGSVVVRIESRPSSAMVSVDGTERGTTPVDVRLAQGTSALPFQLRRAGYLPASDTLVPDRDQTLRLDLAPAPAAARAAKAAPPAPTASSPWVKWH
ncbi:MAG TPA: PEGA domain-containing protein, partial [Polyangiaceae bacterium]